MSEAEFQNHKLWTIQRISLIGAELEHDVRRNWSEIRNGDCCFDRCLKKLEFLSTITQVELLQFYRDHSGASERSLLIHGVGYENVEKREEIEAGSIRYDIANNPADVIYTEDEKLDQSTVIKFIDEFKKDLERFLEWRNIFYSWK